MKALELRKQTKKTQEDVANELKISRGTYANYESLKTQPDIETLCKIADYYGVSLDYLCEHETKNSIDLSSFSDMKKGCIYILEKLTEENATIVFGYMSHVLQNQNNNK